MIDEFTISVKCVTRDEAELALLALEDIGLTGHMVLKRQGNRLPTSQWRQAKIILKKMEPNKHYPYEEISIWLEEADYSPKSATPMMSLLIREGVVGKDNHHGTTLFFLNPKT